jgi:hypothetical protein
MRRLALVFFVSPCYPIHVNTPSDVQSLARIAILGTMADLHHQPLVYDLACLHALVGELEPDLLCAEVTPQVWEGGDLSAATVEVREALNPAVAETDVVLIPVSPSPNQFADFSPSRGWRRRLVKGLERLLQWGQRKAGRPEAINGSLFNLFCHSVCWLTEVAWDSEERQVWESQNEIMAENILRSVLRDPGRRVLVAVQCQRLHRLVPLLKAHQQELEIVHYKDL